MKATQEIIAPTFGEPSTDVHRNLASVANRIQEAFGVLLAPLGTVRAEHALRMRNADDIAAALDWSAFEISLRAVTKPIAHTVSSFARLEVTPEEKRRTVRKAADEDPAVQRFTIPLSPDEFRRLFTDVDARAIAFAGDLGAALVRSVSSSVRASIRDLVASAMTGTMTVDQLARALRSDVPLAPRDAEFVESYYRQQVQRYATEGYTLLQAAEKAQAASDRVAARKLRDRCRLIARTEIVAASNHGRYVAWQATIEGGYAEADSVKEWVAAPDACPTCHALDGERVPWDRPFSTGALMPPDHPACRCSAVLLPGDLGTEWHAVGEHDTAYSHLAPGFGVPATGASVAAQ